MRIAHIAAAIAWSVVAVVLGLAPAVAEKRVALVIGNGDYKNTSKLPNPSNDAADVAAALRKLDFEVVEGRDLAKRAMEDKVFEFSRKLDDASLALFFYAGHGLQVGGKNYLVPIDAKLERAGDLNLETIDVGLVLQQMETDRRVNLIFLDACRDNPLAQSFARTLARAPGTRSMTVGQGLASILGAVGTMIAYATQPDNVASDGAGRNSPFTTALLNHIATPGLEISSLMKRVRADVVIATRERQVPWDHSSLTGEVVLMPGPTLASAPPTYGSTPQQPAQASDAAERAWAEVKDTDSQVVLEDFIRRFGDSFYATIARNRLDKLKKDQVAADEAERLRAAALETEKRGAAELEAARRRAAELETENRRAAERETESQRQIAEQARRLEEQKRMAALPPTTSPPTAQKTTAPSGQTTGCSKGLGTWLWPDGTRATLSGGGKASWGGRSTSTWTCSGNTYTLRTGQYWWILTMSGDENTMSAKDNKTPFGIQYQVSRIKQ